MAPMPGWGPGLTTVGKLEGQHAALMQVQLVLVGLGVMQDFHIAAFHAHGQPLPSGAVAQGEDLPGQTVQCIPSPLHIHHLPSPITSCLWRPLGVICAPTEARDGGGSTSLTLQAALTT